MKDSPNNVSRRHFLAGTGLVIGLSIIPKSLAAAMVANTDSQSRATPMNAFVRVAPDGVVTVMSKHLEMGQGPYTGLTQLVAEEMDADWEQMRVEPSPADDSTYANLAFGMQGTGGSTSIANSYEQFRKAGATAKAMLIAAAAAAWQVPSAEIAVKKGRIFHQQSNRSAGFGEMAESAALLSPPKDVTLKQPSAFKIIGSNKQRLDTPAKTTGKTTFTLDIYADEMLIALVKHAPYFGAKVASFDANKAMQIPGVVDVKAVSQGVAIFAENTFAALKGRDAVEVQWDLSQAETRSSEAIIEDYRKQMNKEGLKATNRGNVSQTLSADGVTVLEAEYVFPYLAHAPMEPLDAVLIKNQNGGIDCYSGAQFPGMDKKAIADICEIAEEKVTIHVQYAGGSFGRRAQFGSPYMREAAEVFKVSGMKRPVKHMWTREDDIRGGFYRPLFIHQLRGAIDKEGKIIGWDQVIAGQSIMQKDELDETSVEGASDLPYNIRDLRVYSHNMQTGVPVLWWRSVGHTHTAFAVEAFLDELLEKANVDPVEGRLKLLKPESRQAGVLKQVSELANKAGTVPANRARGVAVHKSFNTYVAEIAEVSEGKDGLPVVHNVWVAVDCGVAVNPNHIRAQMEGGIGFGLGAILYNAIVLTEGGKVEQSNFHDYRSLRINEMPHVEVAIVESSEPPTGVGEPGVPPIGPAVANAWRRLTGTPVRRLPIQPRQTT
ncbi:xanthine dehydrogenase family protein molybdopterin-binding subunit [Alteromonas pelagimontana]|uniref:Xanthine dehydrogenase family protein molybdopterin-binding subunit n=1 Tax=Alteromonas pelagimontana TaxID=1858656 RepID=A0A6M4M857_9ALTE|nr:xanthine dehydrogenase family protein molybdopterin-binding subunit [Alteromonas pelagimontana]QJR79372.1 xanthine dehydrogenase family protein molybdopterin-binding subunit [Alteromonas pelagimontana]